jgi:hypothetical protein
LLPPWPSKTANRPFPSPISKRWIAASYIFFLQPNLTSILPCISEEQKEIFPLLYVIVFFLVSGYER